MDACSLHFPYSITNYSDERITNKRKAECGRLADGLRSSLPGASGLAHAARYACITLLPPTRLYSERALFCRTFIRPVDGGLSPWMERTWGVRGVGA
jgi:hypothetical protein